VAAGYFNPLLQHLLMTESLKANVELVPSNILKTQTWDIQKMTPEVCSVFKKITILFQAP
jgi:hypothetical protein